MNINEFQLLEYKNQVSLLYRHGVFIGKQALQQKTVILYQIDDFYVEVYYHKYRRFISHFHCFTSVELIYSYLGRIDVQELIDCLS